MRVVTLGEVLNLHARCIAQTGGAAGVRNLGALESALAQPRMSFDGAELYPTLPEKAAALGFSLICNHPFVDGNKRVGHAAIEVFLMLNGFELVASIDESERTILAAAAGNCSREQFVDWVRANVAPLGSETPI